MTTTISRVIGKCGRGHTVNTTADEVRAGWIVCGCGARAVARFMDVRIVESMECSTKCTGATGPVCSCSCGGENHGGRHIFH
jgi:hypothetical protein